jgi:hypothetical protein
MYGSNGTEFMEKLCMCSDDPLDIGNIGLSESVRCRLAIEDPVTFVSKTKEMLVSVCKILLGVQLEHMFTKISSETTQKKILQIKQRDIQVSNVLDWCH